MKNIVIVNKTTEKLFQIFLVLGFSVLIAGCGGETPYLKKYNPKQLMGDKQAIIVLNAQSGSIEISKFDENYNNPAIKPSRYNITEDRGVINPLGINSLFGINFRNAFYTIEPGIYYVSYAGQKIGDYRYFTTLPGLTAEGIVVYGAFEVKPDEVAFLGNIEPHFSDTQVLITVSADLEEAKKEILKFGSSKYKPLLPKLHKITFYPSGSRIYCDKDGVYKLSAKEAGVKAIFVRGD